MYFTKSKTAIKAIDNNHANEKAFKDVAMLQLSVLQTLITTVEPSYVKVPLTCCVIFEHE